MNRKTIFFAAPYEPIAEGIRQALEQRLVPYGYELYRMPFLSAKGTELYDLALRQLERCDICLAVFTRKSTNVVIECAIAAMLGKHLICFLQNAEELGLLQSVAQVRPLNQRISIALQDMIDAIYNI